jgi:large subunit ribosomal protein L20
MSHPKASVSGRARRKKVLKAAKGYRGRAKSCIRVARERTEKGMQYAYRDRRNKKRDFRALWIQRINAGVREHGLVYSQFIGGLIKAGIEIDRRVLSELAISEPAAFKVLCEQAKAAMAKKAA